MHLYSQAFLGLLDYLDYLLYFLLVCTLRRYVFCYLLTTYVTRSVALPDCHSGYGFAIGNVAAFDMADPESIVRLVCL